MKQIFGAQKLNAFYLVPPLRGDLAPRPAFMPDLVFGNADIATVPSRSSR
jgi:hypothetical protein